MNVSEVKAFKCGRCERLYLGKFAAQECCKCATCGSQSSRPGYHNKCDPCQWKADMAFNRASLAHAERDSRQTIDRLKAEIARLERTRPEDVG